MPFAKENQLFFDNNFFYSTYRNSESFDSIHKWDDIYKIIEKEKMFIIYESSNSVLILLERFFYSDKELARVKELIKEKMDAGKYKMLKNK
ncbi:YcxB family protein [Anaerocolumna aminovalerica]|uniref:YcxB family protein n=1 Tax=Anaerocolumna aminovalerica TaxID=1527 RepID=UPI000BE434FE